MFSLSKFQLVPKLFQPYFSKERGPPIIRMQVFGTPGRRFYRIVACHQRDPRDGKHMEVLGTYAPLVKDGVKEIRLRFSRVKFWLGVGAHLSQPMSRILAEAGLIPEPPPLHGRRLQPGLEEAALVEREAVHAAAVENFRKYGKEEKGVFTK